MHCFVPWTMHVWCNVSIIDVSYFQSAGNKGHHAASGSPPQLAVGTTIRLKVWEWEAYPPVGRQGLVRPKGPAHNQHSSQKLQTLYSCCCDGLWGKQTVGCTV